MQIDKIRSCSENIKKEKEKYQKMDFFFEHFGMFLRQFCLKTIPETKILSTCTNIFSNNCS